MSRHRDQLAILQARYAESLGLWAAADPDLDRLAVLTAEAEAACRVLAALPPPPVEEAAACADLAREAERLRQAVAAEARSRAAELGRSLLDDQRQAGALKAYLPSGQGPARYLDQRR